MIVAWSAAPRSAPGSVAVTVLGVAVPDCDECGAPYPSARAADTCADQDARDDLANRRITRHRKPTHRTQED